MDVAGKWNLFAGVGGKGHKSESERNGTDVVTEGELMEQQHGYGESC